MKNVLFLIVLPLLFCLPNTANSRIYLDITSPDFQKMPLAVPYLLDKAKPDVTSEDGKELARILGKGLEFHGFLSVVPSERKP